MFRHRNTFGPRPEWSAASLVRRFTPRTPAGLAPAAQAPPEFGRSLLARSVVRLTLVGLSAAAFTLAPVRPAAAETNDYAKIIMHIVPAAGTLNCNSSKGKIGCDNMKTQGNLNQPYYAFVCVVDGDANKGIAGAEFGIEYNSARNRGVDIYDWNLCATLQFPTDRWPASGTGQLITWDAQNKCQRDEPVSGKGVLAVAGYFYLTAYSPDKLALTRRAISTPPAARVADCSSAEYLVDGFGTNFTQSHLGFVSFSDGATVAGWNPCGLAKPIVNTSWGGLKSGGTSGSK